MLGSTSTLSNVSTQTLTSFFQPLSPDGQIFDPHTLYDATNGRFVVVADEANNSFSKSSLLVAVSEDANPADGWYFQSINSAVKIANRSTWADYPKIAVDGNGDVLINFTASGSALYATDYFAVMPAGTAGFSAPVAYQTSANTAYTQGSNYVARWGDYSSAAADPNNPAGFWVSNEYATSASSWGTALDQVTLGTGTGTLAFLAPTGTSTTTSGSPMTLVAAPTGDIPTQNMSLADLLGSVNPMDLLNIPTRNFFDVKSLVPPPPPLRQICLSARDRCGRRRPIMGRRVVLSCTPSPAPQLLAIC